MVSSGSDKTYRLAHRIDTDFITFLLGEEIVPVASLSSPPEPGAATVLHVKAPSHHEVSVRTAVLLQAADIRRSHREILVFTPSKVDSGRRGVPVRTTTKLAGGTATTLLVNSLQQSVSQWLSQWVGGEDRPTEAGVLLSGQHPNSLSLQLQPSWPGPRAMLSPSGQQPYS